MHTNQEGPTVALNNFLQKHETGDLTPRFHWVMDKEGQDHNAVHIATAMFRGQPVGQARGNSKGAAKHDAAEIVLATLIQGPKNLLSVQTGTLSEFFHTIFPTYPVDPQPNSTDLDPAVALNNFLQSHETGDLTPHFHWVMDKDGQDHNAVHIATAMFRDQPVGQGRGTSKSAAKHDAAEIVLANGMDRNVNDYLHEIQGPENLVPLLHFTSVQKDPNSQVHTGTYTFREVVVGTGQGLTIAAAQREAARQALEYFYTRGLPGGNIEPYLTPMEIFLML